MLTSLVNEQNFETLSRELQGDSKNRAGRAEQCEEKTRQGYEVVWSMLNEASASDLPKISFDCWQMVGGRVT